MTLSRGLVQVAGVRNADEARLIAAERPHVIGLPYLLRGRPEDHDEAEFTEVVKAIPPSIFTVWITYLEKFSELEPVIRRHGLKGVQLHGPATPALLLELKAAFPGIVLWKSLIIGKGELSELEAEVRSYAHLVDAFLTDTWEPSTGKSGATGKTHDWAVSRRLVEISPRPVILAGGLNPENVAHAIRAVKPWGVDAHTGLEDAAGNKEPAKVKKFLAESSAAYAAI